METTALLTIAASLVATLFGLLVALVGWMGSRVYNKLEEMNKQLVSIASDLHERINGIDKRLTRVEEHVPAPNSQLRRSND